MTSSSSSFMLLFHRYHPKMLVSALTPSFRSSGTTTRMDHQLLATTSRFVTSSMTDRFYGRQQIAMGSWATRRSLSSSNNRSYSHTAMHETTSSYALDELNEKIKAKGDEIRQLKATDSFDDKETLLASHVRELLALKAQLPTSEMETQQLEKKKNKKKQPAESSNNVNKKQSKNKNSDSESELTESEMKNVRLAKVEAMRTAKVEPFEYSFDVTTSAAQLLQNYNGLLEPGQEDEASDVAVAGRIMTRRVFGKLAFFSLQDESGTIQLQFDKNRLGDDFQVCSKDGTFRMLSHGIGHSTEFPPWTGHKGLDGRWRHCWSQGYRTTNR
jgi:uncharacterized small protein (DUF1192 family)